MAENEVITAENTEEVSSKNKKPAQKPRQDRRDRAPRREQSDIDKKVVSVRRVQKVVKGGRTLRFSALVVVGDRKGKVGIGIGKSKEVSGAIEKATTIAKKNMKLVPIVESTIPHETIGKFSSTKILLLPAPAGTGVIAGGSARAVIELAGIKLLRQLLKDLWGLKQKKKLQEDAAKALKKFKRGKLWLKQNKKCLKLLGSKAPLVTTKSKL